MTKKMRYMVQLKSQSFLFEKKTFSVKQPFYPKFTPCDSLIIVPVRDSDSEGLSVSSSLLSTVLLFCFLNFISTDLVEILHMNRKHNLSC